MRSKAKAKERTTNRMIEAARELSKVGWDNADMKTKGIFNLGYIQEHGKAPDDED